MGRLAGGIISAPCQDRFTPRLFPPSARSRNGDDDDGDDDDDKQNLCEGDFSKMMMGMIFVNTWYATASFGPLKGYDKNCINSRGKAKTSQEVALFMPKRFVSLKKKVRDRR